MDIIKKIRPFKASYLNLNLVQKFGILVTLISVIFSILPHVTFAAGLAQPQNGPLVFTIGERVIYLDELNLQLSKLYEGQQMQQDLDKQIQLGQRLGEYLQAQGSPLAPYATTLIHVNNWKKILALSNAESGLCKHYPVHKANCWGVGGSNLWYMGSNLKEGILSMNDFLNTYPKRTSVKYSQMSFDQMNGLYKQPAAQHWVDNNLAVYNDLTIIENSL